MDIVLIPYTPKQNITRRKRSENTEPKAQKTLLISEKVSILREVETGEKRKAEIARDHRISANTLHTFVRHKNKILNNHARFGDSQGRKRLRGADNPDVDQRVLKWFKQSRESDVQITGPMLRTKAEQFAAQLGKVGFKASTGWLAKFKTRNNVNLKTFDKISDSQRIANVNKITSGWNKNVADVTNIKCSKDIFTIKEVGLFYKCTPETCLDFREKTCKYAEFSDQRITILMGANMDGSEKLPPIVIGKHASPQCLQHVKSMPVEYQFDENAWMTKEIFGLFCLKMDEKFHKENRKVVFFIESCSAHSSIPKLDNIQVIFFPSVLKSACEPMCQGVIQNFKQHYRKLVADKIMLGNFVDANGEVNINILQAMQMCYSAWDQVLPEIIAECFEKVGFKSTNNNNQEAKKVTKMSNLHIHDAFLRNFINMDENLITCGELAAEVKVEGIYDHDYFKVKEEMEDVIAPVPTPAEVMEYIEKIRRFAEAQPNVKYSTFRAINQLERFTIAHKFAS